MGNDGHGEKEWSSGRIGEDDDYGAITRGESK